MIEQDTQDEVRVIAAILRDEFRRDLFALGAMESLMRTSPAMPKELVAECAYDQADEMIIASRAEPAES